MGAVFRAKHRVTQREAAVKLLDPSHFEADPHATERFVREVSAPARIKHPGIVEVLDDDGVGNGCGESLGSWLGPEETGGNARDPGIGKVSLGVGSGEREDDAGHPELAGTDGIESG